MKYLISVDDTDDLTKATSTGAIAELLSREIIALGGKIGLGITRHQLLLAENIKYTSHNSSMCFDAFLDCAYYEEFLRRAEQVIRENAADIADPGLAIADLALLQRPDQLIQYGFLAKREVLDKESAYLLAQNQQIFLQEYGGTGEGIIGALAGLGLRLSGNDGTFRGKKKIKLADSIYTAANLQELLGAGQILDMDGHQIDQQAKVLFRDYAKLALIDGLSAVIVKKNDDSEADYVACQKAELYKGDREQYQIVSCERFALDNDFDECLEGEICSCFNCLYRRWTADGYSCSHGMK